MPPQIAGRGPEARETWLEFFAAQIHNPNTRAAYARAAYRLFDWLTVRQVVPISPAAAVRGPKHSVRRDKTPVLFSTAECRRFLRSIPVETVGGLRTCRCHDLQFRAGLRGACHEREGHLPHGGPALAAPAGEGRKRARNPLPHNLESYLSAYVAEAGIHGDREGPLFRSLHRDGSLSERRFNRHSAWEMLARRAQAAVITTPVCNHSFRATGITAYLENPETRRTRRIS